MYFQLLHRLNPKSGDYERYCCLKESFRDTTGTVRNRTILTTGFQMQELSFDELQLVAKGLTSLYNRQKSESQELFDNIEESLPTNVNAYIQQYWAQIVKENRLDIVDKAIKALDKKATKMVDSDSIKHKDAREVGTEWICLQALRELGMEDFLRHEGWDDKSIRTAIAHLIIRTVYQPSELNSLAYMKENSAVCELLGFENQTYPSLSALYKVAPSLYKIKDKIEKYLCAVTDNLFSLEDTLILFDLTNFYFEGRKTKSSIAKFGHSKEKRYDCKITVLALCINKAGFVRYSEILEGNTADPDALPGMVEKLVLRTGQKNALLVFDAGITTEENLKIVKAKGYHYLCVSRRNLTEKQIKSTGKSVSVFDANNQEIKLSEVKSEVNGDYYLKIDSPAKALKESSMNRQFKERFEDGLQKIKDSLSKKNGTKQYEKVLERIGRLKGSYPSISRYYLIEYEKDKDNPNNMGGLSWRIAVPDGVDSGVGTYYLRTDVHEFAEETVWSYYNIIREIECTFRQLKTDLHFRPIYHQNDDSTRAHLFLGLLSYWIVNTIRHKLKQHDDTRYWKEIKRVMSTQKAVTSEAVNALGEKVEMRICSTPTDAAKEIYKRLGYRPTPFRKFKVCTSQIYNSKNAKNCYTDNYKQEEMKSG